MQMTIDHFITYESTAERKFRDFHEANPHVYTELVKLARQARGVGRKKIGIGMMFEVLRWNRYITTTDKDFKLNNNYRSRYARLIERENPELEGIFETRELHT